MDPSNPQNKPIVRFSPYVYNLESSALPQAQQSSSYNQGYATYSNQLSTQPGQSVQQTKSQQSTQQPQSLPSTQQPLHNGAMIAPYIV